VTNVDCADCAGAACTTEDIESTPQSCPRRVTQQAIAACLVLAVVLVGCTKAPGPEGGPGPTPAGPARTPQAEAPADESGAAPSTLGEAVNARAELESYEMAMVLPDGKKATQLVKLEDGETARVKVITEGEEWMLVDRTEGVIYAYSPDMEAAIKLPPEVSKGEESKTVTIDVDSFDPAVPIVGSETIDGTDCWVVDATLGEEKKETKVWVGKEDGLLRQVEREGEVVKFTYDKINAVPDSEFELPEGIKIMDTDEMIKARAKTE